MKIDILDDYIRASEWFRGLSDIYQTTRGLPEPPGGVIGPHGPKVEKRRGGQGRPRAPSPSSPNRTRRGRRPPFLPLLSPFLPPLLLGQGKEGVLLPVGVRLPFGAPPPGWPPPPPCSFIYRGRGTSLHTIDLRSFSRVRCPPPPYYTSIIL